VLAAACAAAGYQEDMIRAVFPSGLPDAVAHFSDWADRAMMESLDKTVPEQHRVRDRIRMGCMARFRALRSHKAAVAAALSYWSIPPRPAMGARLVWRTADRIWTWAGDTAQDYNRYTKRMLLAGVLGTTTMAWLQDSSDDFAGTESFLDRRIDQVVQVGSVLGRLKRA